MAPQDSFGREVGYSAEQNPYAAPQSVSPGMMEQYAPGSRVVAVSRWLRFANLLIDEIAIFAFSWIIGFSIAFGAAMLQMPGIVEGMQNASTLIGIVLMVLYYLLFEAATSRTVGKMVTGTKVVNADGGKPTFGQIAGRSVARLIPFEPFSVLLTGSRCGWHDSLPGTYVVKS